MSSVVDGASYIQIVKENMKDKLNSNRTTSEVDDLSKIGNNKKSLCLDIGWTFSQDRPSGLYDLTLNGKTYRGRFNNGKIEIRKELDKVTGSGELIIRLVDSNGNATSPSYRSEIELDLPPVQTQAGLARRLTNLGF